MKTRYFLVAGLMTAAAAAFFTWKIDDLPSKVPVHWNLHGQVDRYGSPWELFIVGPGLMLFVMALFAILPLLSPRRFEIATFERTYLNVMLIIVALFGYIFGIVLWSAGGQAIDTTRAVIGGIAVMAILVGNLLGKVRRNFYVGIRTPWTLASERVWYETHRFGARSTVGGGILSLAAILVGAPTWIAIVAVASGLLIPAVYSLVLYKRLERQHLLDTPA